MFITISEISGSAINFSAFPQCVCGPRAGRGSVWYEFTKCSKNGNGESGARQCLCPMALFALAGSWTVTLQHHAGSPRLWLVTQSAPDAPQLTGRRLFNRLLRRVSERYEHESSLAFCRGWIQLAFQALRILLFCCSHFYIISGALQFREAEHRFLSEQMPRIFCPP